MPSPSDLSGRSEPSAWRESYRLASVTFGRPSEISSLTQVNKPGYLREALTRPEFQGRLLYGTDFPLINTALVSPYFFPLNLTAKQMVEIHRIENPWDRDVALKQALGVPTDLFIRSQQMFRPAGGTNSERSAANSVF